MAATAETIASRLVCLYIYIYILHTYMNNVYLFVYSLQSRLLFSWILLYIGRLIWNILMQVRNCHIFISYATCACVYFVTYATHSEKSIVNSVLRLIWHKTAVRWSCDDLSVAQVYSCQYRSNSDWLNEKNLATFVTSQNQNKVEGDEKKTQKSDTATKAR